MSTYLEERIEWYDHNYSMGTPLISDAQFDQLEANLYRVNPKANYFRKKTILTLPSLPKDRIEEFINGLLILGTCNNSCICSKIFRTKFRLLDPRHIFLPSYKQMTKILIEKGFKIEKTELPFFKTDYFNIKKYDFIIYVRLF